jgi:uncharacterized protein
MKRLLIVTSSLLALVALAAVTRAGDAPAAAPEAAGGITVQGTASVDVVPDRARLSFGVETQAASAKAALDANAAAMRRLLAALRAGGLSELQTQYVGVSPRYTDGKGTDGFTAHNSVTGVVQRLGQVGTLIDAAATPVPTQVSGPSFFRADTGSLYREALEAAVADARRSAEALARGTGLTLGRVTAVVEGGSAPSPLPFAARAADEGGSTPVEPGRQQVTAGVTVTFAAS